MIELTREGKISHYIINEAYEDRCGGTFATYKQACKALKRYDADDLDRCQPAIGAVYENGFISYEL